MKKISIALTATLALGATNAFAEKKVNCPVSYDQLTSALTEAQAQGNGQFKLDMWASVINSKGIVCAVTKSGENVTDQWLASRVISAQKAYTSASLSNNKGSSGSASDQSVGFTSAGLYTATQPGGPLFGLQHSNPVDTNWAYHGKSKNFGTNRDPMIGRYVGGINVFGGGLPLFDADGKVIGGLGVSGNTSCADHNIAWRIRGTLSDNGIAQGADFEFGINYTTGYPSCGHGPSGDNTWNVIGTGGTNEIDQMM